MPSSTSLAPWFRLAPSRRKWLTQIMDFSITNKYFHTPLFACRSLLSLMGGNYCYWIQERNIEGGLANIYIYIYMFPVTKASTGPSCTKPNCPFLSWILPLLLNMREVRELKRVRVMSSINKNWILKNVHRCWFHRDENCWWGRGSWPTNRQHSN